MSKEVMEAVIRNAFSGDSEQVVFGFQGGEPTLAGLEFYQTFVSMVDRFCPFGCAVSYTIQTNGLNLDKEWANFLHKHHFLVGLSLDGTRSLHDANRQDTERAGTWDRVVNALKLLYKHHVETNIVCVITEEAAHYAAEVYKTLKTLGAEYLQFIPCLGTPNRDGISAVSYVYFLCELFDLWFQDWYNGHYTGVRQFDDYVHLLAGKYPSCCTATGQCGEYLVVESDGSVYPCDFYATDEFYLGNLAEQPISDIISSSKALTAIRRLRELPRQCSDCRWFNLCQGGCHRLHQDYNLQDYCNAQHIFFSHAVQRLQAIAALEQAVERLI